MKKNYSVSISAFTTVVVMGAESEEQAGELAWEAIHTQEWNQDDVKVTVIEDNDLDRARSHADAIAKEED